MNPFTRPISRAILLVLVDGRHVFRGHRADHERAGGGGRQASPYTLESLTVGDFTSHTGNPWLLGTELRLRVPGQRASATPTTSISNTVAARTASGVWTSHQARGSGHRTATRTATAPDFFVFRGRHEGSPDRPGNPGRRLAGQGGHDRRLRPMGRHRDWIRVGLLNGGQPIGGRGVRDHGFIGLERPASRFRRRDSRPPVQQPGRGSRPFLRRR